MIVTYIERTFIDRYTCIDRQRTFMALSYFVQGGLTYFKLNQFNYKVIETDFIISVEEV